MRSEEEMFELIVNTARQDGRVRAVILNGSRANPNSRRDIFQDYDILYLVSEVDSFKSDPGWIERFGELMILQLPDTMGEPPPEGRVRFAYLMQLADGNRIDLTLFPVAKLRELERDSLSVALLDKDGLLAGLPPANESDYLPRPPTAKAYAECCNEFWWLCPYVAKGLWRGEILYAKSMLDQNVRAQLMNMLTWYIGVKTGFTTNPGKLGKYFQEYLEPELWQMLLDTYSDASYNHTWAALFRMGELFRVVAFRVGQHFGNEYPFGDDLSVRAHLRRVRNLPGGAQERTMSL